MKEFDVDLVAVEERFWSGRAEFVAATTSEGEIGIYAGHQPLLAELAGDGIVIIRDADGQRHVAAVAGGFLSVTPTRVAVLADEAWWADSVDVQEQERIIAESPEGSVEAEAARGRLRAARRLTSH